MVNVEVENGIVLLNGTNINAFSKIEIVNMFLEDRGVMLEKHNNDLNALSEKISQIRNDIKEYRRKRDNGSIQQSDGIAG